MERGSICVGQIKVFHKQLGLHLDLLQCYTLAQINTQASHFVTPLLRQTENLTASKIEQFSIKTRQ